MCNNPLKNKQVKYCSVKCEKLSWKIRNKDKQNSYARKSIAATRISNRAYTSKLKAETPCSDCGISYPPYVMDFDHIGDDKVMAVSKIVQYSRERLIAEIAKCEVVCSNCHRIRTHLRS